MSQPSKISRLPEALRDELNRRLADNESSATLLPWLNALPAVRAVLAAEFASRPISKQNLCKWRAHGFAAWQLRREMLAQSRPTTVDSTPAAPSVSSVPDPAPQWSEHLSQLLAMHYFDAMSRWDGHSDALCRPKFRALRALCREVHQLRHADHARERLQLQYDRPEAMNHDQPSGPILHRRGNRFSFSTGEKAGMRASFPQTDFAFNAPKTPKIRSQNLRKPQQNPASSSLVKPENFLGRGQAGLSVQVSSAQVDMHRMDPLPHSMGVFPGPQNYCSPPRPPVSCSFFPAGQHQKWALSTTGKNLPYFI
jgi:hypothetical protein